jgi:exodeoxyribonuclease VII small subunit
MAKKPDIPEDIQAMSYEQARDELVQVVSSLEQGNISLDESIGLWERGEALAKRCEMWLTDARDRLEKARNQRDG